MSKKRRSAIASVKHSGFQLVERRKRRGKLATERDFAKIDFEPWSRDPNAFKAFSDQRVLRHAINLRLAYAIMTTPRDRLIEMYGAVEYDTIDNYMANFQWSSECFKGAAAMLEAAHTRLLASACARHMAKGKFLVDGKLVRE